MCILSILALPLTLLEYFFTKERLTEETEKVRADTKLSFREQFRILFTDKYMVLMYAYFFVYTVGMTLKNTGLVYYCNYVLGTYNDGVTQMLVSVIGGIPMGIGIFAVWPLAKRFGKRNVTMWGFLLYALGSLICWLFPHTMWIVLTGQFIKNIGGLPCAYVFMALFADCLDHLEWKSDVRIDGAAMSVYNIIAVAMVGIMTGFFNWMLAKNGYQAPLEFKTNCAEQIMDWFGANSPTPLERILGWVGVQTPAELQALRAPLREAAGELHQLLLRPGALSWADAAGYLSANGLSPQADLSLLHPQKGSYTVALAQPEGVYRAISFAFVGLEFFTGLILAFILRFVNVEKDIDKMQAEIKARHEARGKA
jgi:Na+/melibiose symporter-like transporter